MTYKRLIIFLSYFPFILEPGAVANSYPLSMQKGKFLQYCEEINIWNKITKQLIALKS
jgi:hypothetical protein